MTAFLHGIITPNAAEDLTASWVWLREKLHPRVKEVCAYPKALQNLPNRLSTSPELPHRVQLELLTVVGRPHPGLLASKSGGKASKNPGPPFGEPVRRVSTDDQPMETCRARWRVQCV